MQSGTWIPVAKWIWYNISYMLPQVAIIPSVRSQTPINIIALHALDPGLIFCCCCDSGCELCSLCCIPESAIQFNCVSNFTCGDRVEPIAIRRTGGL